jgi:hypothetical protein
MSLLKYEIELTDLTWDSGYGDRDAVINATVLWNEEKQELDIQDLYFGWVDQDGGDHEASDDSFCEKEITKYIHAHPEKYDQDFNEEDYYAEREIEARIDAARDDKL